MAKPERKGLGLSRMTAAELLRTLAEMFARMGPTADEDDAEIARELIRRARRAEEVTEALGELLTTLAGDEKARETMSQEAWRAYGRAQDVVRKAA
jgi:hypothetical protein